jgi:hypothetical protein
MPEVIAALCAGLFLTTPIIWLLTKHQQKMTQLLNERQRFQAPQPDVQRQLAELTEIVHQQTIAIDNLSRQQLQAGSQPDRLSGV